MPERSAPLKDADELSHVLRWKGARPEDLVGKVIRLAVRLRNARLYSVEADLHFLDAQDKWMLEDGKAINTRFEI